MRYLPINVHVIYILTTLFISFYGPRKYIYPYDKSITFLYIIFYLIVVAFGFHLGMYSKTLSYQTKQWDIKYKNKSILKILKISLILSIFLYIIYFIYLISRGALNLSLSSLGENYRNFYSFYYEKKETSIFTFELIFLLASGIPKFLSLVLGFYYYSDLKKRYKKLFISLIVLIIITQTLGAGNQKSLGDIAIIGGLALTLSTLKLPKQKRKKVITKVILIGLGVFALFSYAQYSRLRSGDITLREINDHMAGS